MDHPISYPGANINYPGAIQSSLGALGFVTGNPRVGKFQPVPVPAYTVPVSLRCCTKPTGFLLPAGSYSFNLLATSQEQPAHVNRCGGAFREVLEEVVVVAVVMRMVRGPGGGDAAGTRR